jgi:hypothetical protein
MTSLPEATAMTASGWQRAEPGSPDEHIRDHRLMVVRLAFVLFAFTLPFDAVNLGQWSRVDTIAGESSFVTLPKMVGYLFFLATLIDWRRCYARVPGAVVCFVVYFAWYALRGALGDFPNETLGRAFSRVQMLILLLAGYNLLADDRIRRAVFVSFGCSCSLLAAFALGGLLDKAMVQITDTGTIERVTGLTEDPNNVAAILSVGLISLLSLVVTGARIIWFVRMLGVLAVLALGAAIVHTGSRGGMLALCAGLICFAVGEPSRLKMFRNVLIGTWRWGVCFFIL